MKPSLRTYYLLLGLVLIISLARQLLLAHNYVFDGPFGSVTMVGIVITWIFFICGIAYLSYGLNLIKINKFSTKSLFLSYIPTIVYLIIFFGAKFEIINSMWGVVLLGPTIIITGISVCFLIIGLKDSIQEKFSNKLKNNIN